MPQFKHIYMTPQVKDNEEISRLYLHQSSVDGKVAVGQWNTDGVSSTTLRKFDSLPEAIIYYTKLAGNLNHYIDGGD